ncbi:NAD-dependent epimerase/dehydratase family protein [Devosia psychrophila]|jgi:nucleoside-diphosphate-sugar epimerase|uniref:Epimerase n=1 Tax=Devosia psychrophila TaxID=728005 RepID=A0A0F5Q1Q1_9HYPH|nr:NAD(P)-dependent oxidoreductase [Devosia psychrophila]KKC34795.1 epimerase [Devosia psychrophila]SFC08663.1 Nucleoside-diphosphate-sugar epimerase [Devosia psychrophila]
MARIVVIGATGHIGSYLVPRLVRAGHEVAAVTRGASKPYADDPTWAVVERVTLDRDLLEKQGEFGTAIAALKPEIVIDNICFTLASASQLAEALIGKVQHFLHIGTIWTHGFSEVVPTPEDVTKRPFGDYGIQKAAIERYLLDLARRRGFPVTILHPGHIVGEGWSPLNPAGHFDDAAFATLAHGKRLALPNFGMETVHHVHADDIAQLMMLAIANWGASTGEAFHAVSPGAITLRHYAEAMSRWFGHEPNLEFLPWEDWKSRQSAENAESSWGHISRSPNCSIDKGRRLLGHVPRYSSLAAVQQSVSWLIANGKLSI